MILLRKKKHLKNIVNNKLFFSFYAVENMAFKRITDYPLLNFINNTLDVRNTEIHINVEQKPTQTEGSVMGQPLANIDLIDSVDCVSGKMKLIDLITECIPSTGHIMPVNESNVRYYT